jgi:hypothetical protein
VSDVQEPDPIYTNSPIGPVIYDERGQQQTYFLVIVPFVGDASCMHFDNIQEVSSQFKLWLDLRSQGQFRGLLWAFYGHRVTMTPLKPVYDVSVHGVGTFEVSPKRDFDTPDPQ